VDLTFLNRNHYRRALSRDSVFSSSQRTDRQHKKAILTLKRVTPVR